MGYQHCVGFFEVFCDVEPKRKLKALAAANAELAAAQEKLSKIKGKIKVDKLFIDNYLQYMYACIIRRNYIIATRKNVNV